MSGLPDLSRTVDNIASPASSLTPDASAQAPARRPRRSEIPLVPGYSRKGTRYFVQGPVSLEWLLEASICGRKGMNVGLAVQWLSGVKKQATVTLTREALEHFRVTPSAAVRILQKMQSLNLCIVETKRGRGPRVTIGRKVLQQLSKPSAEADRSACEADAEGRTDGR